MLLEGFGHFVLVIYDSVTNHPEIYKLKTPNIYYLTVSRIWEQFSCLIQVALSMLAGTIVV